MYHVSYNGIFKLKLVIDLIDELSCDVIGSTKRGKQITHKQVFSRLSTFDMGKLRKICWKECLSVSTIAKFESDLLETIQHVFIKIAKVYIKSTAITSIRDRFSTTLRVWLKRCAAKV